MRSCWAQFVQDRNSVSQADTVRSWLPLINMIWLESKMKIGKVAGSSSLMSEKVNEEQVAYHWPSKSSSWKELFEQNET